MSPFVVPARSLAMAFLLAGAAAGDSVVTIIREMQEQIRLVPGRGIGRSPEQCRQEGAGNALEITGAALAALRASGYPAELVAGQAELTERQMHAWRRLPAVARQDAFDSFAPEGAATSAEGGRVMDLAWCRVLVPWLPGLGLDTPGVSGQHARQWLNVFPALMAFEVMHPDASPPESAALRPWMAKIASLTTFSQDDSGTGQAWSCTSYPCEYLRARLDDALYVFNVGHHGWQVTDWLSRAIGFPGCRWDGPISPKPVLPRQVYFSGGVAVARNQAEIVLTLADDDGLLAQAVFPQQNLHNAALIIHWQEDTAPGEPAGAGNQEYAVGNDVHDRQMHPTVSLAGLVIGDTLAARPFGADVTVRLSRRLADGTVETDGLTGRLQVGALTALAVSTGTLAAGAAGKAAEKLTGSEAVLAALAFQARHRQDLALRLLAAVGGAVLTSNLQATLGSREAVFQRLQGRPVRIGEIVLVTSVMTSQDDGHWVWPQDEAQARPREFGLAALLAQIVEAETMLHQVGCDEVLSPLAVFSESLRQNSPVWCGDVQDWPLASLVSACVGTIPVDAGGLMAAFDGPAGMAGAFLLRRPDGAWQSWLSQPRDPKTVYRNATVASWPEQDRHEQLLQEMASAGDSQYEAELSAQVAAYSILAGFSREAETGLSEAGRDCSIVAMLADLGERRLPPSDRLTLVADAVQYGLEAASCRLWLRAGRVDFWAVTITDDSGRQVFAVNGQEAEVELSWDFRDPNGREVPDGLYHVQAIASRRSLVTAAAVDLSRDCAAPAIQAAAECRYQAAGKVVEVWFSVYDANAATVSLQIVSAAGQVLLSEHDVPVEAVSAETYGRQAGLPGDFSGSCLIVLTAVDAAGNSAVRELPIDVEAPSGATLTGARTVRVSIPGLSAEHSVISGDAVVQAVASGLDECSGLAVLLDGEVLLQGEVNVHAISGVLPVAGLSEGRHVLAARVRDRNNDDIRSPELVFHYSRWAGDFLAPQIVVTAAGGMPPAGGQDFSVAAWDNQAMGRLLATAADGAIIREAAGSGSEAVLEHLVCTAAMLEAGVRIVATDTSGNQAVRTLQYPLPPVGAVPRVELLCELPDQPPLASPVTVLVAVHGDMPLSGLAVSLNGAPLMEVVFPEETLFALELSEQDLCVGDNLVTARAWDGAGRASLLASLTIKTPVFTQVSCTPTRVQPWAGTAAVIAATAQVKASLDWVVELLDASGVVKGATQGRGMAISAQFPVAGLTDGAYGVRFSAPSVPAELTCPVEVDAVRGLPIAVIASPVDGAVVTEGVVSILGSATTSEQDQDVKYALALWDDHGTAVMLLPGAHPDGWLLTAMPGGRREPPTPPEQAWREQVVQEGCLAMLDLSAMPDGRYRLRLSVHHAGQTVVGETSFSLHSMLKLGHLSFVEEDLRISLGDLGLLLKRHYSSVRPRDCGFGPGWSTTLTAMDPVIDEERVNVADVSGTLYAIRGGGSRDVTVTLANGRRVTFAFALEEGGAWSFCYHAVWQAPPGVAATLVPDVDERLMALPGLEPYWAAAGPLTPWENYDFPGFVLTDLDGVRYHLTRPWCGEAELLATGREGLGLPAGAAASIAVYGDLRLTGMFLPDGSRLAITETGVQKVDPHGGTDALLTWELDPATGRHTAAVAVGTDPGRVSYVYDELGNLIEVRQARAGGEERLKRRYAYGLKEFPHHVTSVHDASGCQQMAFVYDDFGRLVRTRGPDGTERSLHAEPAAGYAVATDPLGHETILLHDPQGRVLTKIGPDGARTSYEYDAAGRENAVTNPLGHVTRRLFDTQGRLLSRTDHLGRKTSYKRRSDGACLAVMDPAGRVAEYSCDAVGRVTSLRTLTGLAMERVYDAAGRPVRLIGPEGEPAVAIEYGAAGRLEAITGGAGTRLDYDYDQQNRPQGLTLTYFHPEDGSAHELATVWDYDADGRLSQAADSLGHWRAFEYDASGKAAVFTDSSGAWLRRRHDAVGRVVEQWNQDGMLQRTVYDAAGRPAMQGSGLVLTPENLDQPPAVLTFPQVCQFLYDVGGNQTAMITLSGGVIERVPLGNGLFTCQALFPGQEESRRQFQYDLAGRMVAEESAMGLRQVYQRDAAGQITALTSPGGGRWLCSYGQLGEVLSTTDPLGHVTRFEYDRRGLPAARINPDGGRWDFVFDAQGRMVAEVDPAGHCREIERDAFGQPVRHGLPPLRETTAAGAAEATGSAEFVFDYHSGYFLAGVTDPQSRLTTFRRDEFGRVIGEQLPGGQECRIFYDDDGLQPSRYWDFAGHETTYAYLNHKLLLRREHRHALQPDVVRREYDFSYDAGGRLRQIRRRDPGNDQTQTVAMDYDSLGRLNQRRLDDDPGVGYEYDQDDRPIRLEGAMSGLRFDYAEDGLCAGITVARAAGEDIVDAAEKLALTRDLRGLPRRVDFPDGGSAIIEWDGQSRPIAIRHADASGQLLYGWGTVYDVSGRQVASQEDRRLADGRMLQRNRAWRYDAWGRLRHEDSQAPGREWLSYTQEFTYDLSGNRMTVDRQYDNGGFRFRRCQYDVNDRLLSETRTTVDAAQRYDFAWDDNGSLTAMYVRKGGHDSEPPPEMPPTHERQFLWDCENRLTAVVLLDCDGQGRTILEQRTDFTYDPQGLLIGQKYVRTAADGSSFSRETHFVYAGLTVDAVPRLLETVEHRDGVEYERRTYVRSGMVLLIYSSRHGRLRCLTDQAGSVHGLCNGDDPGPDSLNDYDAWGEALPGDGEPAAGPGFAGEWYDPETGLVYLRSRFYWPEFGIFISRDRHPGDPEQPLSLHRYAYCRNDPVNHCDPTGCFGVALAQAAMMSVGGFPLLSYWRGGIEYLSGWFENQAMTLEFAAQEREHDQAAVIVHGLQYHSPGYADDFIDLLKARGVEFDSYQFIWSGCQLAEVMLPPNRIHHGMALASLTHCLAQLPAKGYSRVHVIAHSWGTVLSRDALGRHPLVLSHWVTMGSPLSAGTVPQFPYQAWMNISTRSDPVVHLAPLVCAVGFTDGFMPLYTQKPPPLQIDLGSQAADPHGSYWHDPLSLARIAALLRQ